MATILVLDDRRSNRAFLVELLGYAGYALLEASDGGEALTLVRRERPDLVIADILMPRMDGYEFVRQLRSDPAIAATPVILYTATYEKRAARELAGKCGVRQLLRWPVEPAEILRAVAEVLGPVRAPAPVEPAPEIDRDHLRLLMDTLAAKVRELEEANRRLKSLSELGRLLALERDPLRLLDRYCRAGRGVIGAQQAILAVLAEDPRAFRHVATDGLDAGAHARLRSMPGASLLSRVLATGVPLRIAAGEGRPLREILPGYRAAGSFLAVPVATPAHRYGVFALLDKPGLGACPSIRLLST
jgi:CheY-like chemotaxis protein